MFSLGAISSVTRTYTSSLRFRLMAYDHDLLSFTDQTLNEWPLLLVTNPKNAQFSAPSREPTGRMRHSTHVRILAFSPSRVSSVRAWVDGTPLPSPTPTASSEYLFTSPWDPERFSYGLHTISVSVKVRTCRIVYCRRLVSFPDLCACNSSPSISAGEELGLGTRLTGGLHCTACP